MTGFGHEKLDVYRLSLEYVAWVHGVADELPPGHRHAKDQILRASQSITLNIAEGNGRGTHRDRRRFFEFARGSALECAALQDVLSVTQVLPDELHSAGKRTLHRIVSMLTRMIGSDGGVREQAREYSRPDNDYDYDRDYDGGLDTPAQSGSGSC